MEHNRWKLPPFYLTAYRRTITVKTKAYIPGLNDSAYAAEFSLRPEQRVNSGKVSVNYASCVLFAKIPRVLKHAEGWRVKYAA